MCSAPVKRPNRSVVNLRAPSAAMSTWAVHWDEHWPRLCHMIHLSPLPLRRPKHLRLVWRSEDGEFSIDSGEFAHMKRQPWCFPISSDRLPSQHGLEPSFGAVEDAVQYTVQAICLAVRATARREQGGRSRQIATLSTPALTWSRRLGSQRVLAWGGRSAGVLFHWPTTGARSRRAFPAATSAHPSAEGGPGTPRFSPGSLDSTAIDF